MNTPDRSSLTEHGSSRACVTELLSQDTTAAARARALVAQVARTTLQGRRLAEEVMQDAAQVASELAANAVRHGNPPVLLRVSRAPAGLRIEVSQRDDGVRDRRPVIRSDRFGLQLVAALSQSWGTSLDSEHPAGRGGRRIVWAQIESTSSGTSAPRLGSPSQG